VAAAKMHDNQIETTTDLVRPFLRHSSRTGPTCPSSPLRNQERTTPYIDSGSACSPGCRSLCDDPKPRVASPLVVAMWDSPRRGLPNRPAAT